MTVEYMSFAMWGQLYSRLSVSYIRLRDVRLLGNDVQGIKRVRKVFSVPQFG